VRHVAGTLTPSTEKASTLTVIRLLLHSSAAPTRGIACTCVPRPLADVEVDLEVAAVAGWDWPADFLFMHPVGLGN